MSDRPAGRPVPPLARTSARKRANTADGTNDETSTERHPRSARESPRRSRRGEVTTPRKHHQAITRSRKQPLTSSAHGSALGPSAARTACYRHAR